MAENYGFEAGGDYAPAYEAARRRLMAGFARQRGDLAQAVASRGVRTSGVSFLPQETLERGQSEAEAGLIGNFAQNQAENSIADRRAAEQRAFEERMLRLGYDLQGSLARRMGKDQLTSALIGGGIGAVGSAASGFLSRPTYKPLPTGR